MLEYFIPIRRSWLICDHYARTLLCFSFPFGITAKYKILRSWPSWLRVNLSSSCPRSESRLSWMFVFVFVLLFCRIVLHFLYHGNASCNVTFLTIGYGDKYFGDISSYQTFSITSFSSIFYSYIGTWLWVQAQTHWSREILPDQCKDIILRSSFLLLQPFSGSKPRSTHLDGSRHFALSKA